MPPTNIAVSLKGIHKTLPGPVPTHVLHGVSTDIIQGSITAIVGQSGSGKTTLMNCIGLLDVADRGELVLAGEKIADKTPDELAKLRNKYLGFVFQFHFLLPEFTVIENVLMPLFIDRNGFRVSSEEREKAMDLLRRVGMGKYSSKMAGELSGGQQQRVAIARALFNDPAVVLADEPTGNLDSKTGTQVLELFRSINKEQGTTFVIVTHDERIAAQADEIITIRDGGVVR